MQQDLQRCGPGYCCIIGDSITEAAPLAAVDGRGPINAGIGGARVADALRLILPTLEGTRPAALLLAIGVNDTKREVPEPPAQRLADFARDYQALVRGARQLTPHVGLVAIGPVAKGTQFVEFGDNFFDPALIVAFNNTIATIAAEMDVPLQSLAGLAGADGLALPDVTDDGVHLSAAGYAIWNAAIAHAWQTVMPVDAV